MASHHSIVTIRPRNLANVLADLKEAHDDLTLAHVSCLAGEPDADDRYTEAETRADDLTAEFEARFADATGLTIADLWKAREEAVL